jgi:peroxiredoxin Q/BCP
MSNTEETLNNVKLQLNDKAPDFKAKVQEFDQKAQEGIVSDFHLYDFLQKTGKKVLLIFYPGDDTPGCTAQLCGVRDVYQEYERLGVKVLGVNPKGGDSHLKFIKKYNFPFGIIIDEDKSIREKYGAVKKFFSATTTKRGVFLIDEKAEIKFIHWGQQDNQKIFDLLK